jgi:hypothetical protein
MHGRQGSECCPAELPGGTEVAAYTVNFPCPPRMGYERKGSWAARSKRVRPSRAGPRCALRDFSFVVLEEPAESLVADKICQG